MAVFVQFRDFVLSGACPTLCRAVYAMYTFIWIQFEFIETFAASTSRPEVETTAQPSNTTDISNSTTPSEKRGTCSSVENKECIIMIVCVVVGVLLVIGIVLICLNRRCRNRKRSDVPRNKPPSKLDVNRPSASSTPMRRRSDEKNGSETIPLASPDEQNYLAPTGHEDGCSADGQSDDEYENVGPRPHEENELEDPWERQQVYENVDSDGKRDNTLPVPKRKKSMEEAYENKEVIQQMAQAKQERETKAPKKEIKPVQDPVYANAGDVSSNSTKKPPVKPKPSNKKISAKKLLQQEVPAPDHVKGNQKAYYNTPGKASQYYNPNLNNNIEH